MNDRRSGGRAELSDERSVLRLLVRASYVKAGSAGCPSSFSIGRWKVGSDSRAVLADVDVLAESD